MRTSKSNRFSIPRAKIKTKDEGQQELESKEQCLEIWILSCVPTYMTITFRTQWFKSSGTLRGVVRWIRPDVTKVRMYMCEEKTWGASKIREVFTQRQSITSHETWTFIVTAERTSSIEGRTCFEYVSRIHIHIHILYKRLLYSASTPEGSRLQPRKQLCYNDCSLLVLQVLKFSEMERASFSEISVIF